MDEKLKQLIKFIEKKIEDSGKESNYSFSVGNGENGHYFEGCKDSLEEIISEIREVYNLNSTT